MAGDSSIGFCWVIGTLQGEKADYILGLANHGIGYFMRNVRGKGKTIEVEAASRWLKVQGEIPEHLIRATSDQARKLDLMFAQRHSIKDEPEFGQRSFSNGSGNSNELVNIMQKSGMAAAYKEVLARKHNERQQ